MDFSSFYLIAAGVLLALIVFFREKKSLSARKTSLWIISALFVIAGVTCHLLNIKFFPGGMRLHIEFLLNILFGVFLGIILTLWIFGRAK